MTYRAYVQEADYRRYVVNCCGVFDSNGFALSYSLLTRKIEDAGEFTCDDLRVEFIEKGYTIEGVTEDEAPPATAQEVG